MRRGVAGMILLGGIIIISVYIAKGGSRDNASLQDPVSMDPLPPVEKPIDRTLRDFDHFLQSHLDSMSTVGAAATVFHENSIAYTLTYGVRRAGTSDSVDQHTVFRLASVSKGFAGVLAGLLEKDRKFKLEDPVISFLPGFRLKDSVNTVDLNIQHLLNHTSGLVPHAFDNLAEEGQTVGDILPRLAEVNIAGPPGMYYGYQNVLFSLLDTISRVATGDPYPELMDAYIFHPLGMEDASTGYRELVWDPNVAFPHYKRKGEFHPLPLHTGYYNLLPAAGVNASIHDMGIWLEALLGNKPGDISPGILELISSPQVKTPLKRAYTRRWDPIDGRYYSHGWRIFDYKGHRIMYHGGYVRGYRAEIAFCPELKTGMAFLQNSPNGVASRCVPTFFNLYLEELQHSERAQVRLMP